jgi:hypothetical protein
LLGNPAPEHPTLDIPMLTTWLWSKVQRWAAALEAPLSSDYIIAERTSPPEVMFGPFPGMAPMPC